MLCYVIHTTVKLKQLESTCFCFIYASIYCTLPQIINVFSQKATVKCYGRKVVKLKYVTDDRISVRLVRFGTAKFELGFVSGYYIYDF